MNELIDIIRQSWYADKAKHGLPCDDDAFEAYINSMSNLELLREISWAIEERMRA